MRTGSLAQLPNLISLLRALLGPVIIYFLASQTVEGKWTAFAVFLIAGGTDWLDGYLARSAREVTQLGIALDPIADKLFAACVVVGLVLYGDLPSWVAGVIVGRDLVILLAGLFLLGRTKLVIPANLTGKYAFASIATLCACSMIGFADGYRTMLFITLGLIVASLVGYAFALRRVLMSGAYVPPVDRLTWKRGRIALTVGTALVLAVQFFAWVHLP